MTDQGPSPEELAEALRDERSMRYRVEQRNNELSQRVDLWRQRAEERTARIDQLERERDIPWLRHMRNRVRRIMRDPGSEDLEPAATDIPMDAPSLRPRLPIVRMAAALTSPELVPLTSTVTTVGLDAVAGADVVVIEPRAVGALSEDAKRSLKEWAALPGRQPLVVWTTKADLGEARALLGRGDVVAATTTRIVDKLSDDVDQSVVHAPPTFDPALHSPVVPARRRSRSFSNDQLDDPPGWLVEQAAHGAGQDDAAGVALRRWAFRHHAPWVRARVLFAAAELPVPVDRYPVAGILVSNRPDQVVAAATRILDQRTPNFRLAVGLHGFEPSTELEAVLEATQTETHVHTLPSDYSLGACLNAVIAETPASVLAKIDDDDHYGPSYLDDALHAMEYTDAEIIGKGAHYTYLGGSDRTVLRRPQLEEQFIDTMTTGSSLVFERGVWEAVRFPHRTVQEDTWFLGAGRSIGARVYANTRFEFTYVRSGDGHTWQTDEATFETGSVPAWAGLDPQRAFVPDFD